ncbi:MBL fold metallo-hydrolase [Pseudomonas moorei]|uniref:MBL fold metallo-hydrolase n=1 Tax=Pseudomonas moorei TaxID=395599 RepID=UPI0036F1CD47
MNIEFVNHASLLLEENGSFFLTDPWYISPAFGGWIQTPSPNLKTIEKILSLPASKLNIIISHGHDDHLDEFFIQKHLAGASFFVPKFKTNGLSKRIERLTGRYPVELTEEAYYVEGVELRCFKNPEFTEYDSIVTITSETDAVIHANDNWHEYPAALTNKLNECLSAVPVERRYFFIQFGIADSFPVNYPSFDNQSADEMIESRFKLYQAATTANLKHLGLDKGYYYANQSLYQYPASWDKASLYDLAQDFLRRNPGPFIQCSSGINIKTSQIYNAASDEFFDFLLGRLETFINNAIDTPTQVKLMTSSNEYESGTVGYEASRQVWSRILNAELTLEAIIIGGMGLIHRPNQNISNIHSKVSKLAYLIQSKLISSGLNFLMESK